MKKRATMTADVSDQAERIIKKFGNANRLSLALKRLATDEQNPTLFRSRHTIIRWTYPEHREGTGGVIPSSALQSVLRAARREGILITSTDLYGETKRAS